MFPSLSSILFLLLFPVTIEHSTLDTSGDLTLYIQGCRNDKGYLLVSLFNQSSGYPADAQKAFKKIRVPVKKGITVIEWKEIPEGNYAIAVLHDENEDGKMNTSLIGLPKEGYAFSNNAMGLAGPPSFTKASFEIKSSGTLHRVQLRY
jgi:uncharacterized protein (DUF2141 family)